MVWYMPAGTDTERPAPTVHFVSNVDPLTTVLKTSLLPGVRGYNARNSVLGCALNVESMLYDKPNGAIDRVSALRADPVSCVSAITSPFTEVTTNVVSICRLCPSVRR